MLQEEGHTSHCVRLPTDPAVIPDIQSPLGSLSKGMKARSLGSISNTWPPKVNETTVEPLQGTVKPPWPSNAAPGISSWMAMASARGRTARVVPKHLCETRWEKNLGLWGKSKRPPVSRMAVLAWRPRDWPSMAMSSRSASQKPLWLTLGTVISVFESNLAGSSPLIIKGMSSGLLFAQETRRVLTRRWFGHRSCCPPDERSCKIQLGRLSAQLSRALQRV